MKYARMVRLFVLGALVVSLFGPGAGQAGAAPIVFVVNSKGDGADATPGDHICADATGKCTLRAAITEANLRVGLDKIKFKLGGPRWGIRTIVIESEQLPMIEDQVYIDATTHTYCKVPCVALDGHLLPPGSVGPVLAADNSIVRGLIIHSFPSYAFYLGGDGNIFQRNFVGFLPGETTAHANGEGIHVMGSYNLIGGTTAEQRNVISGNNGNGILLNNGAAGIMTTGNIIRGNYIGTNATGTAALPNGGDGIWMTAYAYDTIIGGTMAGAKNVISGNVGDGIEDNSSRAIIQGNYLGTKANGRGSIPNGGKNIYIKYLADGTMIGGTSGAARNKIANSLHAGIVLETTATEIAILRNQIYGNAHLGIDLDGDHVTPNDEDDLDTGPNGLQNYPDIGLARSSTAVITGTLNSKASQDYRLEFFWSPAGSCANPWERSGKTFLGALTVTTNVDGDATFSFHSPRVFAAGSFITATATHVWGTAPVHYETSEFSECVEAQ